MSSILSAIPKNLRPRPDVYPLIAAVTAGCSFGVYSAFKHRHNPDVKFDRSARSSQPWEMSNEMYEQGVKHGKEMAKHYRHKDSDIGHLSMFEAFSPSYWSQRMQVAADAASSTKGGASRFEQEASPIPAGTSRQ